MAFERRTELSPSENEAIKAVFEYYDKSADGKINVDELKKAMLEVVPDEALNIAAIIDNLDANGDKTVDFEEFSEATTKLLLGRETLHEIQRAFKYMDRDGNGFLSPPELKKLLTTTGSNPLTVDEAEELIMWADKDGDGVLNYKEFTYFLCGAQSEKMKAKAEPVAPPAATDTQYQSAPEEAAPALAAQAAPEPAA